MCSPTLRLHLPILTSASPTDAHVPISGCLSILLHFITQLDFTFSNCLHFANCSIFLFYWFSCLSFSKVQILIDGLLLCSRATSTLFRCFLEIPAARLFILFALNNVYMWCSFCSLFVGAFSISTTMLEVVRLGPPFHTTTPNLDLSTILWFIFQLSVFGKVLSNRVIGQQYGYDTCRRLSNACLKWDEKWEWNKKEME